MSCTLRCPVDAVRPGFLNAWRVTGHTRLKNWRKTTAGELCRRRHKGYFRLFRPYYRRTAAEIDAWKNRSAAKDEHRRMARHPGRR
jgi:hypothetical protein